MKIKTDIYICESECAKRVSEYQEAVKSACSAALADDGVSGTLNISFVGEDDMEKLNADFRNIGRVTDVLSFPANELSCPIAKSGYTCDMEIEDDMLVLGDIAVCVDRAESQAKEYGHSFMRELCFLAVHGTLHLMGYDHMTEEEEKEMFEKQEKILHSLGIDR